MTPRPPGRVLALDLGDARVGMAVSDPLGVTAQPAGTIESEGRARLVEKIREVIDQRGVVRVVVGLPLHLSGAEGARAKAARSFARALASTAEIDVETWDERLSTAQVERTLIAADVSRRRRREVVDSLSAVLILQSYLDARAVDDARHEP